MRSSFSELSVAFRASIWVAAGKRRKSRFKSVSAAHTCPDVVPTKEPSIVRAICSLSHNYSHSISARVRFVRRIRSPLSASSSSSEEWIARRQSTLKCRSRDQPRRGSPPSPLPPERPAFQRVKRDRCNCRDGSIRILLRLTATSRIRITRCDHRIFD